MKKKENVNCDVSNSKSEINAYKVDIENGVFETAENKKENLDCTDNNLQNEVKKTDDEIEVAGGVFEIADSNVTEKHNKKTKKPKKPIYKRAWIYIVSIILLVALGIGISMPFSYEVQAFIIRIICMDNNPSKPNNYQEILSSTEIVASNLSFNSNYSNGIVDIIAPKSNEKLLPLVLYIHGGYYAGGDKKSKEPYCRMVANEGYIVANMNYVLTPDEQYPAQLIQANEALKYLTDNAATYKIDATKIFIGGDSAGGHLSGILGALYTNNDLAIKVGIDLAIVPSQLKGVLLLCGFFDMMTVRATKFPLVNDAMWMLTGVKKYEQYARVSELNTINNVTKSYPNTYIVCGDKDPFYSQNIQMVAKLNELGIDTTDYLPKSNKKKLKHEFQSNWKIQEAHTAFDMLKVFLAEKSA